MRPSSGRPFVGAILPVPGARVLKIGSRCLKVAGLGADHQAIAALDSPYAAAGAGIDVLNAFLPERDGAADIVFVIRIAAIDQNVAGFEERGQLVDHRFRGIAGGNHEPGHARFRQLSDESRKLGCAFHAFLLELRDFRPVEIERNDLMSAVHQTARHVAAHFAETYHSDLH